MMQQTIQVPNRIFLEEVRRQLQAGHTATFRVRGWSMRPFLEHGRDKVLLVSPKRRAGNCTLWGDGNIIGRETCTPENVIGVADGFYIGRKERFFHVDGRVWRCYSWLWMHVTAVRRYLLWAYRIGHKLIK